ncbi:STAS domain-containing protein [Micromonospora sp. HNM0581]|uniref:STAS domain-containing protein n=1 Tax=Micromonospora sp. HNM0581 TaxID=2716341 RepID=UPI0032162A69
MIQVVGDLAYMTAAPLRVEIDRTMDTGLITLILDFGGLKFIDSTGLSVIVHAWREGQQRGVRVRLRSVPRFLGAILDMTGVTGLLAREPTVVEPAGATPDDRSVTA